jgi:hypothetical protein
MKWLLARRLRPHPPQAAAWWRVRNSGRLVVWAILKSGVRVFEETTPVVFNGARSDQPPFLGLATYYYFNIYLAT